MDQIRTPGDCLEVGVPLTLLISITTWSSFGSLAPQTTPGDRLIWLLPSLIPTIVATCSLFEPGFVAADQPHGNSVHFERKLLNHMRIQSSSQIFPEELSLPQLL